jgi:hypothetical protein
LCWNFVLAAVDLRVAIDAMLKRSTSMLMSPPPQLQLPPEDEPTATPQNTAGREGAG